MNKEELEEFQKKLEEMYWELKDSLPARFLQWRGIDDDCCPQCKGAGRGVGKGFLRTVCDICWGSGEHKKSWQPWE